MALLQNIQKLYATSWIGVQNILAYRMNFFLEVCAPVLAFFLIRYNIWVAIYGGYQSNTILYGYTLTDMLAFQCWSMIAELIIYGYNGQNMASEIRFGKISSYLLYPVSFTFYQFGRFLGIMLVQVVIALVSISIFYISGLITNISVVSIFAGITLCLLSATIWYWLNFISGVIAFWMEETWYLRAFITLLCRLIGGAVVPLEFFPEWLKSLSSFLPFTYMIFYPTKILAGATDLFTSTLVIILIWCLVIAYFALLFWKQGVKSYTSAGA